MNLFKRRVRASRYQKVKLAFWNQKKSKRGEGKTEGSEESGYDIHNTDSTSVDVGDHLLQYIIVLVESIFHCIDVTTLKL
ncbi:hypothetical protein KP509_09G004200 [Ceratopteris richardii]|uniref:Uncharacterized protein n=1 Tax=Ceratopteris richardii TaxID=49495 RepID=A0A8T2U7H5_CERRI|nr:hypothetical protein KP509_09G004200 [Ceratopteris richardii]KAH7428490.1 hypothetical protein KP509_09G004200 [Ceratopteris richardii]